MYAWQNFQLWRLASQHRLRTDKLVRKTHLALSSDLASPENAAVALYLGSRGDYADRRTLRKKLATVPTGLVKRCLLIAVQELNKAERNLVYDRYRDDDLESAALVDHLQGLREPIYVDNPPRVRIEDLPDVMPSIYE